MPRETTTQDLSNQEGLQISVISSDTLITTLQAAVDKLVTARIVAKGEEVYASSIGGKQYEIKAGHNQTILELTGKNGNIGRYSVHRLKLLRNAGHE